MSDGKKAKVKALQGMMKGLTKEQRLELVKKAGIVNIEGKSLSIYNQCMLMFQRDSVSIVGGFQQWKKANRHVKSGESSLIIWFPCGAKKTEETEEIEKDLLSVSQNDTRFMLGNVFDISQTEENIAQAQN